MHHRWKIFIAVSVVLLIFTAMWVATIHWQAGSEVDTYRKLLLAKGEKLEIGEVTPAPVPPERNGVMMMRAAFGLFRSGLDNYSNMPPMMCMVAPGKAMVCFQQPEFHGKITFSSWQDAALAVEEDRPAAETLWQVMNYPAIDFQLDYSQWPNMAFNHLAPLKRSAQRLSAAAIVDLHNGNTMEATTNVCALVAIVRDDAGERTLISQLVRIAMAHIAGSATWELLQATNLTDAELAMLQTNWEQLEFIQGMENSLLMERAASETLIKKMRASDEDFNKLAGSYRSTSGSSGAPSDWIDAMKQQWDDLKFAGAKFMWRTSWTYSDELRMLRQDQIILQTLRFVGTNQPFYPACTNMQNELTAIGITNNNFDDFFATGGADLRQLFSGWSGAMGVTVRKAMAIEVLRRIVATAIALKRFQLKHGNLPEKLSELTPDFLTSVPLDPVDGKPLRYRRNADGTYLLYSVGENGTDNGGNPTVPAGISSSVMYWQNSHALDWVWPQPATGGEIQAYYASKSGD